MQKSGRLKILFFFYTFMNIWSNVIFPPFFEYFENGWKYENPAEQTSILRPIPRRMSYLKTF